MLWLFYPDTNSPLCASGKVWSSQRVIDYPEQPTPLGLSDFSAVLCIYVCVCVCVCVCMSGLCLVMRRKQTDTHTVLHVGVHVSHLKDN